MKDENHIVVESRGDWKKRKARIFNFRGAVFFGVLGIIVLFAGFLFRNLVIIIFGCILLYFTYWIAKPHKKQISKTIK